MNAEYCMQAQMALPKVLVEGKKRGSVTLLVIKTVKTVSPSQKTSTVVDGQYHQIDKTVITRSQIAMMSVTKHMLRPGGTQPW